MRYFFFVIVLLAGCRQMNITVDDLENGLLGIPVQVDESKTLTRIALGSCNKESKSQKFWKHIVEQKPDLWIWLGDNVYGDTDDMNLLANKYAQVKGQADYQALMDACPIIGIWDDHDYGVNDGGKSWSHRDESQTVLLDFLGVPKEAEVRQRPGIYQRYTFGEKGQQVAIILLDTRYFRDDLQANTFGAQRYIQNTDGDILGEAQWQWLENTLQKSEADVHLIASGYQMIPEEQIYEKWSNFPMARQRLFDLIEKTNAKNAMLLSGDRHISELSKIDLPHLAYPLYEFTSSGLTHTWSANVPRPEPNRYRVGEMVIEKSFGMLRFDWKADEVVVTVQARGFDDELYLEEQLTFVK